MGAKLIKYHPKADEELQNVHGWYFGLKESLGEDFLKHFYASLNRISEMPQAYPSHIKRTRKCIMSKYPYKIIFRERRDYIEIVAISHASQKPGYWKRRI